MEYLAAFQTFADLEPKPNALTCRFAIRYAPERISTAQADRVRGLQTSVQKYRGPHDFAWERMVEEASYGQQSFNPQRLAMPFNPTDDDVWFEQSGWMQVRLPYGVRWVVERSFPHNMPGQTIVNSKYVFHSSLQIPEVWERAQRPLHTNAAIADVVLAHIQPRLLLGGWDIHTRTEGLATESLTLERRYPVGTAPNVWDDDWPAPHFTEADRVVVTIDAMHHVITGWDSTYHGVLVSEVRFTDIDASPHLTADDFDPVKLGLSAGPPDDLFLP